MKIPRPSPLTILTAALVVLLPTLALLQYRWVGQVSEAERERMQTHLRNAALQFHEALDGEIFRAVTNLQISAATAREGSSERYADRYEAWAATAAHPQVVAGVYLLDDEGGKVRVRRWNTTERALEGSDWPAVLDPWREAIDADRKTFASANGFGRPPLVLNDEALAIAPLRPQPAVPGTPPDQNRPTWGFTVVHLDMPFIQTQLLAELSQRYFGLDGDRGYRVTVVSVADPSRVIYRSDDESPMEASKADAVEPLFGVTGRGLFNRGGGRGGDNRGLFVNIFRAGDGPRGFGDPRDPGRWTLLAQHESGSLEAAVAATRRRNLGISSGILALLSVTVLLLTTSSRRAERLARQQMEFVAGVSHELRTPIAVIRSASENLAQGVVASPDRVKRYGDTIGIEARRLGDMVERVLQYAGIEAGRVISSTTPLEPLSVVEAALQATAPLLAASGITVEKNLAPDLPLVMGDPSALTSAIQNLLTNGVKYGGSARWLAVSAVQAKGPRGPEVRVSVEDHGPGIPHKDLPHLFEPFYRGVDATSAQIQGNGLGLSIVKRIVEAHGGRVTVSTRQGAGTAFTIHLPAAPEMPAVSASMVGTRSAEAHS
ncbi:MAG: HAMP domain-containing sensor histidine kinase [Vicinamibacterales bacterium]